MTSHKEASVCFAFFVSPRTLFKVLLKMTNLRKSETQRRLQEVADHCVGVMGVFMNYFVVNFTLITVLGSHSKLHDDVASDIIREVNYQYIGLKTKTQTVFCSNPMTAHGSELSVSGRESSLSFSLTQTHTDGENPGKTYLQNISIRLVHSTDIHLYAFKIRAGKAWNQFSLRQRTGSDRSKNLRGAASVSIHGRCCSWWTGLAKLPFIRWTASLCSSDREFELWRVFGNIPATRLRWLQSWALRSHSQIQIERDLHQKTNTESHFCIQEVKLTSVCKTLPETCQMLFMLIRFGSQHIWFISCKPLCWTTFRISSEMAERFFVVPLSTACLNPWTRSRHLVREAANSLMSLGGRDSADAAGAREPGNRWPEDNEAEDAPRINFPKGIFIGFMNCKWIRNCLLIGTLYQPLC